MNSTMTAAYGEELQARKDWDLEFAKLLVQLAREQRKSDDELLAEMGGTSAAQDTAIVGAVREAVGLRLDVARVKAHVARLLTN